MRRRKNLSFFSEVKCCDEDSLGDLFPLQSEYLWHCWLDQVRQCISSTFPQNGKNLKRQKVHLKKTPRKPSQFKTCSEKGFSGFFVCLFFFVCFFFILCVRVFLAGMKDFSWANEIDTAQGQFRRFE